MNQYFAVSMIFLAICLNFSDVYADTGRMVCDDSCSVESAPATQKEKSGFTVVSPVGRSSVKTIKQAPRLDTLAGKI